VQVSIGGININCARKLDTWLRLVIMNTAIGFGSLGANEERSSKAEGEDPKRK
jgi:hypothetical protein